jgi:hypothetical protein
MTAREFHDTILKMNAIPVAMVARQFDESADGCGVCIELEVLRAHRSLTVAAR